MRSIERQPAASQRSLASRLGVSVGRVNYCLNALIRQGWVKADNFRRSDRKLAYAYLLTPEGMEHKARITRDFLKRKVQEYEALHAEIDELRAEVSSAPTPPQERHP